MKDANRRLMWHGILLFLLGLLTGLAEDHFTNVRMGLAAHLEGLMNGTFLLALGGRLERGETDTTEKAARLLDCALRNLCELALHHGCRRIGHRSPLTNHSGRP